MLPSPKKFSSTPACLIFGKLQKQGDLSPRMKSCASPIYRRLGLGSFRASRGHRTPIVPAPLLYPRLAKPVLGKGGGEQAR